MMAFHRVERRSRCAFRRQGARTSSTAGAIGVVGPSVSFRVSGRANTSGQQGTVANGRLRLSAMPAVVIADLLFNNASSADCAAKPCRGGARRVTGSRRNADTGMEPVQPARTTWCRAPTTGNAMNARSERYLSRLGNREAPRKQVSTATPVVAVRWYLLQSSCFESVHTIPPGSWLRGRPRPSSA